MGFRKMYDFKDFLAVSYTGETPQQDLNAKKRHRMVGMWEDAAKKKELPHPSLGMKRDIVGEDAFDAVDESPAHREMDETIQKTNKRSERPSVVDTHNKEAAARAEKAPKGTPALKVSVKAPIGHRIADIGPGGTEHNVVTNPAWKKSDLDESPAHKAVHSDYMHLKLSLPDTVDKYDKIHTHLKKKHGSAADEYFKGTPPAQMHHD